MEASLVSPLRFDQMELFVLLFTKL